MFPKSPNWVMVKMFIANFWLQIITLISIQGLKNSNYFQHQISIFLHNNLHCIILDFDAESLKWSVVGASTIFQPFDEHNNHHFGDD